MKQPNYFDHLETAMKERIDYYILGGTYNTLDEISEQMHDDAHEICDSCIPVYYGELSQALQDDFGLAEVDDEGLLPENPSVWQIIQTAIYENLIGHFYEILEGEMAQCRDEWYSKSIANLPSNLVEFVNERLDPDATSFDELLSDIKDNVYNDELTVSEIETLEEELSA